jgi:hypothetical protein
LSGLRLQRPDPPDLTAARNGGRVAIELAEIVCEEAARRNANGENVYRVWRPGDLAGAISAMLARKDAKKFHGGPFHETIVCLFTDEPALTVETAMAELTNERFGPFQCITSSFLLFSYRPATKSYPVLQLRHHA